MKLNLLLALFSFNSLAMGMPKHYILRNMAADAAGGMSDPSNVARAHPDGQRGNMVDSSMHQNPVRSQSYSSSDEDSLFSNKLPIRHGQSDTDNSARSLSSSSSDSDSASSDDWILNLKKDARFPDSDTDYQTDSEPSAKRLKTSEGTNSESESFSDTDSSHSTSDSDYSHSISEDETFRSNAKVSVPNMILMNNNRRLRNTYTPDSRSPIEVDMKKLSPDMVALINKQKRIREFRLEYHVLQDLQKKFGWDKLYIPFGQLTVKEANGASKAVNPLIFSNRADT